MIGCACTDESCYLALSITTRDDTKRVTIVGNMLKLQEPVVILDADGIATLRKALEAS